MLNRVRSQSRLLLISGGRLCTLLVQRLLCFNGKCAVSNPLRLGISALSRSHFFDDLTVTCPTTLVGHWHYSVVRSVAFDSRDQNLLATSSSDNTAKLWRFSPDGSTATCVVTLAGRSGGVYSVAFHPTAPLLATGSDDKTAKLWRFSPEGSNATCVATLEGHNDLVLSVAFHPMAPFLATGSRDTTVKLWSFSPDGSAVTCVTTLDGQGYSVIYVAFHPTAPLLAISSCKITKLLRFSANGSTATCVATLEGHSNTVFSVAFHPTAPILVTGSSDGTTKLWR